MTPLLICLSLLLATACGADEPPVYPAEIVATYDAPNARQGVAVDSGHFYAVNNYAISKHSKLTGDTVASWSGNAKGEPLIHLDSLMELHGRLYASHSNYPVWPMTSSIEVWEAESLRHVESHSFGVNRGSLTWLDRHRDQWWGTFANYDKVQAGQAEQYGGTDYTQVVRFDETFDVVEAWSIPLGILDRMRPMSNSGGSWGPDGFLYLTGHDRGEAYVMRIPDAGSELWWVATVRIPGVEGQGIAWDRSGDERILWAINKQNRAVLKVRMPEIALKKR